jgi:hypothetical protein
MMYAFVHDIAASWHDYQRVTADTVQPAPAGLILHLAGPTDEGFRIIGVWESKAAWERFQAERVAPAIAALGGPARPEATFRDLQVAHIVAGVEATEVLTGKTRSASSRQSHADRRSHEHNAEPLQPTKERSRDA